MTRRVLVMLVALAVLGEIAHAKPRHRRLVTDNGVVHVWTPDGYDPKTAGIVVYLHGYYTTVDRAWRRHRLPRQFARAKVNALFVACATPDNARRPVAWTSLQELLATVAEAVGELPEGRRVVVAHSGGHRTVTSWLSDPVMETVVLIDAFYDLGPEYRAWVEASGERRFIDIAVQTREWADTLHQALEETQVIEKLGDPRARESRIVYMRSKTDHMELVTGGRVIPAVLRMLSLPPLTVNEGARRPSSLL